MSVTLVAPLRLVHRGEDHLDGALLAAAHHRQLDSRAYTLWLEDVRHRIHGLDSFAVDRNDQVAQEEPTTAGSPEALQASLGGGAAGQTSWTTAPSNWLRRTIDSVRGLRRFSRLQAHEWRPDHSKTVYDGIAATDRDAPIILTVQPHRG